MWRTPGWTVSGPLESSSGQRPSTHVVYHVVLSVQSPGLLRRLQSSGRVGRVGQEAFSEPRGAEKCFPGRPGEEKHPRQREQPEQRYRGWNRRGLSGNRKLLGTRGAISSGKEPWASLLERNSFASIPSKTDSDD